LNAARTAFSLPFLSNLAPSSSTTSRARDPGSSADACFGGAGVRRPRRLASAFTAIRRASISASSSRANDPAKSLGSKCRPCESALSGSDLDGWTGRSGGFPVTEAVNRSGGKFGEGRAMRATIGCLITATPVIAAACQCRATARRSGGFSKSGRLFYRRWPRAMPME